MSSILWKICWLNTRRCQCTNKWKAATAMWRVKRREAPKEMKMRGHWYYTMITRDPWTAIGSLCCFKTVSDSSLPCTCNSLLLFSSILRTRISLRASLPGWAGKPCKDIMPTVSGATNLEFTGCRSAASKQEDAGVEHATSTRTHGLDIPIHQISIVCILVSLRVHSLSS